MKEHVLTAFFPGQAEANRALAELASRGVRSDEISVIPKHVAYADDLGIHATTKAPQGIAIGAVSGGLLGALVGAMAAAGAIVLPGAGSVLAGPLVAALAGAGLFGALGVILGGLLGASVPAFEARLLDDAVGLGGSLVAVRAAPSSLEIVERVLESCGGRLVRRASSVRSSSQTF